MNLKTIHQKVPAATFLRVSKSFVVNKEYIESFDNHNIYIGETEIPLGEVYRAAFFDNYAGGFMGPEA